MKVFIAQDGTHIDLGVVFSISSLQFDLCSEYGIHTYEKDWYVILGVKGMAQVLKFSLGCAPTVQGKDDYDYVQRKRREATLKANAEYTRLIAEWTGTCAP